VADDAGPDRDGAMNEVKLRVVLFVAVEAEVLGGIFDKSHFEVRSVWIVAAHALALGYGFVDDTVAVGSVVTINALFVCGFDEPEKVEIIVGGFVAFEAFALCDRGVHLLSLDDARVAACADARVYLQIWPLILKCGYLGGGCQRPED